MKISPRPFHLDLIDRRTGVSRSFVAEDSKRP
jgi:hypothetical protein